jgi:hypothetical protein
MIGFGDPVRAMKVFINYRRDDSAAYAGRVHDRLVPEFGRDRLFMDVAGIRPGADFVNVLGDEVAKCDVLLALIGPRWIDARDENGSRRLDSASDFVRIEIATALKRDIPVIPILLDGATIPSVQDLPRGLEGLVRRNGLDVRHASFHIDMDRLIAEIRRLADEGKIRRANDERTRQQGAISNIPIRVPIHFMGREDALDAIETALARYEGRVVTASPDGTARIWDTATATEIAVLRGHDGTVNSAAFSPDGSRIVTASGGTAHIWDARLQTMSAKLLLTEACARLSGLVKLTRYEMRLAGYPDSMPEIDVCE